MSIIIDPCYGNIIGLSRTECSCDTVPDWASESDSGLWMDELEGMNLKLAEAAADCQRGNVWELMETSRYEGVEAFKTDLLSCIRSEAKIKRSPFNGIIGDARKANKWVNLTYAFHGFRFNFDDIQGGYAKAKRIGVFFNVSDTFDITVYNNIDDTPITTIEVTTVANTLTWIDISPVIDFDINNPYGGGGMDYYFIYEPSSGMKARNTIVSCGCGGFQPTWNMGLPQYRTHGNKGNYGWASYAMAVGVKGNDLSNRSNWATSNETQGILLDMQFGCDTSKTICNGELDYVNNPFALSMAWAIRYKADAVLISKILTTGNINRYSLLDGETLVNMMNRFNAEYNDRVFRYLCPQIAKPENVNTYSDCFTCNDPNAMVKSGLFN
jgi:hypothetical protein